MSISKRLQKWTKRLVRVALGVGVGLGITEVAFHVRDGGAFAHINVYTADAELGTRLRPGASQKIRFGSAKNPITSVRINESGYRGGAWPAPAANEVIVVGDSQTFGLGVEENETFASVLQTAMGDKAVVRNLGVPTYGPKEYNAVLKEQLERRPAKTVIWVANMVNDLFEVGRPNNTRHVVWDGWAVRTESAPKSVWNFPGRSLLYTHSHAFLALRRFNYERGERDSEQGFPSEGTWKDIGAAANQARSEHAEAQANADKRAKLHELAVKEAKAEATSQTRAVDAMVRGESSYQDLGPDQGSHENNSYVSSEQIYAASRLSVGDIVTPFNGEVERDVRVTAEHIRRGLEIRNRLERKVRQNAERQGDKKILGEFAKRDALEKKVDELLLSTPQKPEVLSPLTPALKEAKALCDKAGARLIVLVLPIDVQVSVDEWKKYNVEAPVDMSPSRVLNHDVVVAAASVGAEGLDVLPALAAAEPNAFLDGDIHMTPKGHRAVGEALAKAIKTPKLQAPDPSLPLPNKRSHAPKPSEWTPDTEIAVTESDPAGCETKMLREWLGIFCRTKGGAKGVKVLKGIEVMAGALPGEAVLIAPMIAGQEVRATFAFDGHTREFSATMDGDLPVVAFSKPGPNQPNIPGPGDTAAYCACAKDCTKATAPADADCTRTYANDCPKMLACAAGAPDAAPVCAEGHGHFGVTRRCKPLCSKEVPCAAGTCTPWQGGNVCL
jgi:hypothetical protein